MSAHPAENQRGHAAAASSIWLDQIQDEQLQFQGLRLAI
jgi:hypothetical protein